MMRQKFWKELRSRLCPRQNWHQDQKTTKCECCRKQFTFFNRKHHCRFCGKIYCSDCSDLYINGTYLGLSEKYVRHCEFCREDIQKLKQDLNRLAYLVEDQEDLLREKEEEEGGFQSDEDSYYFSIKHIFHSVEKDEMEKIIEDLQADAKSICKKIFKKNIELGFIPQELQATRLLETINRALSQCRMNILPEQLDNIESYMDVSQHIEVKTLTGEPGDIIEAVQGIVLENSIPIKTMESVFFNPQIILIENTLDESIIKIKFEELISNDKAIYEFIEQKIMRLNPDIIFVEKSVNRQMLRFFSEQKICVINGIPRKEFNKIAYMSGAKPIKNVLSIGKYQRSRFIGSLNQMKKVEKPNYQEPLLYIQKQIGTFTILLSERDSERQRHLKKALEKLMRMMRQVHLEKFLIYIDYEMKPPPTAIQLMQLNPMYKEMTESIKFFNIIFYKLVLKEIKRQDLDKKQKEYCKIMGKYSMLDICGEGVWHQFQPYSQLDTTIGHFLLTMATNYLKKCQTCKMAHRKRFYFKDRGIEITANALKASTEEENSYLNQKDVTVENMHTYLKKYKEDSNIFSYFKCQKCSTIVSKKSKIGKNYLKNSFHYLLMLLAIAQPQQKQAKLEELLVRKMSNDGRECGHLKVDRYIETFNMQFRLQVYDLKCNWIDNIDLHSATSQEVIRVRTIKFIEQLIKKTITARNNYLTVINNWLVNYLGYLEQNKNNNSDPKIIELFSRIRRVHWVIDKVTIYLADIQERENNKQIDVSTDWTFFNREIAKVDYVLKTAIYILIYIENKLSKKKVVQKLLEEQQQLSDIRSFDHLLPEIIINQRLVAKKSNDAHETPVKVVEESCIELKPEKQHFRQISEDTESRNIRQLSISSGTFAHIESNLILKNFLLQMKRKRYHLKKGQFIYFNYLNWKDHISILAYALNSVEMAEEKQKTKNHSSGQIKFNIVVSKNLSTNWQMKQQIDALRYEETQDSQNRQSYEIVAYYHQEFEEIRRAEGISYEMYVRSITSAQQWEDNSGGKSNSYFAKSNDSLLVIKTIKEAEFIEFQKFACSYINHMKAAQKTGRNTILTKIFGLYELQIKGSSYKCVVMQNLFFNLDDVDVKVYDLKGSETNRSDVPSSRDKKFTGLDTNFKIDKNCQPYILEEQVHKHFYESLQEDILFLSKNEVIDYSLLVIEHSRGLRLGVIDFMRPYHLKQMIEKTYKQFKYGQEPTVLPPHEYASRFMYAVKRYFMPKVGDALHN